MRFGSIAAVLGLVCATGCLRIIDLDDDEAQVDAIVVNGDAFPPSDGIPPIDSNSDLDCSVPLPCPPPDSGKATVCGWIHDAETDEAVAVPNPTRQACSGATTTGPCSLRVRYYDALDFAMNPNGAVPITPQSAMVDDCGRFRATNLNRATFGFIGIAVDDAPTVTPAEPHRITGVAFSNAALDGAEATRVVRAYATRVSTDQLWSAGAGISPSFGTRGVLLKVFVRNGQPVAGVTARRNGTQVPADDLYFSDTGVTRRMIDPTRTSTGPNGSVLIINSDTPIAHDGVGGEPSGCQWPSNLAASIPGAVFVQRQEPETPAGAPCP